MLNTSRSAVLVLATVLAACDAPTGPSELDVELTASPDPSVALRSSGVFYTIEGGSDEPDETREYPWRTSFVVNLKEKGGLGVSITTVNVNVKQASGGIVITPTGGEVEHYQFNSSASGNRLPANGSASVGFEVWYDLPNRGAEALVTVGFSFRDDDDYTHTDSIEVRVVP